MKAVVWLGPRRMELQSVPEPTPRPGEAILRVDAVGICGSELSGYLGQNSLRVPPLVMGHEFAGTVGAIGADLVSLRIGDRVTVNPLIGCGECALCRLGLENLCPKRQIIGIHRPGAFAEQVAVPATCCTRLPDGLSQVAGALAEPLGCGVRAANIGAVGAGSRVLILGAGAIGLMCVAAVRKAGGAVTLAADPNVGRLQTAAQWGAEHVCDTRSADPAEAARELTGGLGVDVAIDAVGTDTTRRAAVRAVRPGGTVVLVGLHEADSPFEANYIVRSEIRVSGSFSYTQADFAAAVAMLAAGDVAPSTNWLQERDLEECSDSFAELIDNPPSVSKIVLRP
ncbi:MAG TPA: galactitol-1-phosphate 5-dehydrogenase [Roseiflexaceae bacterium]|nr:galactitol-1-phosphate 5-dehydrogenase [Roseiflexaceae bacterium]